MYASTIAATLAPMVWALHRLSMKASPAFWQAAFGVALLYVLIAGEVV